MTQQIAECFPLRDFVQEELDARGWTRSDLLRAAGTESTIDELAVDILMDVDPTLIRCGSRMAALLAFAFGVSPRFFITLDASYHLWVKQNRAALAPEKK